MKTAISLPDPLFEKLDARAKERGESRSAFLAEALRRYLEQLEATETMRELTRVYEDPASVAEAQQLARESGRSFRRTMSREDW